MKENSPKWYGRVPVAVAQDHRLPDAAVRLYSVMAAYVKQGTTAGSVGQRRLGEIFGWSQPKVSRMLSKLVETGHVIPTEVGSGVRGFYHFTSPVFGQKQRSWVKEVVSAPSGGKRLASISREEVA